MYLIQILQSRKATVIWREEKLATYFDFPQANNGKPALNRSVVIRRKAFECFAFTLQDPLQLWPCTKTEMSLDGFWHHSALKRQLWQLQSAHDTVCLLSHLLTRLTERIASGRVLPLVRLKVNFKAMDQHPAAEGTGCPSKQTRCKKIC